MMTLILKHLTPISVGLIIVGVLLVNEVLFQLILYFRDSFLSDIIHFVRVLGWFFAPVAVFMWTGDVAHWIEQQVSKHK